MQSVAQLRQGDVLLVPCERIPRGAKRIARDRGRVILAYGEHTGHAHAISSPFAHLFSDSRFGSNVRYLEVSQPVRLSHEEHDEVEVPKGTYRVNQQRQYDPNTPQPVAD
jgi:hypothetical protein